MVAQVCDVGPVDHPSPGQPPAMIKTVEEPDSISNQDRHNVQLQLIDQPSRQGLSCDVGTASDGRVAIARGLLGGPRRPPQLPR